MVDNASELMSKGWQVREKFAQLPNGFGFGTSRILSVFIDASFDSRMSVETNTYDASTLSSSQKFKPI